MDDDGNDCSSLFTAMIFREVKYFLSTSLPRVRQEELSEILDANGAQHVALRDATHVVTDSHVFEGYQTVSEDVAVITVSSQGQM